MHNQRQQVLEQTLVLEGLPVDRQPLRPAAREPGRHRREEPKPDLGAGNTAVGELRAMAAEIAAAVEAQEHALDPVEHARVVGIGAQEAERLVKVGDLGRSAKGVALERAEQRKLPRRAVAAVLQAEAVERGELRCRVVAGAPVGRGTRSPATTPRRHFTHRSHHSSIRIMWSARCRGSRRVCPSRG